MSNSTFKSAFTSRIGVLPRASITLASMLISALFLFASIAPALAQSDATAFRLTPETSLAKQGVIVIRDIAWKCTATGCVTSMKSISRPAIVCAATVREIGPVATFTAGTEAFDADALAKCNKRAK